MLRRNSALGDASRVRHWGPMGSMAVIDKFLAASAWMQQLSADHARRAREAVVEKEFSAGAYVCHKGRCADVWVGVADGLVKLSSVASALAEMFNPVLYPATTAGIDISQEELGYLAGVSRQRVNRALRALEKAGIVKVAYGRITVLDRKRLSGFGA